MCRDALVQEKLLLAEPEAIRIDRFIGKHFNCQISYEDLGPGFLGCTGFNTNGSVKVVAVSNRLARRHRGGERRLRATIAHEGGYELMHSVLFMPSTDQGRLNLGPVT